MTPAQLRAFSAVVRLGSVRAAAEELGVSDAGVSMHVAQLRKELDEIANAKWENLEHLEIWTGSPDRATATMASLEPFLAARGLPRLRHLGIVNSELSDELIGALATSAVLPQLDSIDLSKGIASADAAGALVGHARAFRHLAALDLSSNHLAPADIERIRDVLDNVMCMDQREMYDGGEGRYVEVGE